ncbi:neuropeptide S [Varanus komodoensis]|uniref:neuropeptide S n=1 Tax=Varanus komodoensis TaxID=61221 RepID=UPI001CF76F17|nr:neuropeptide S [Varanus komodoensis]
MSDGTSPTSAPRHSHLSGLRCSLLTGPYSKSLRIPGSEHADRQQVAKPMASLRSGAPKVPKPDNTARIQENHYNRVKINVVLLVWISTMHVWTCYPIVPSALSGKSDYCLLLLNSCQAQVDGSKELALLKPFLEKTYMKRSFRNGVGSGIKKVSFRRAKA